MGSVTTTRILTIIAAGFILYLVGIAAARDMASAGNPPVSKAFALEDQTLLIMGQDLESLDALKASNCCRMPAGVTGYLGLYNLLSRQAEYGGSGLDADGRPLDWDADWGGGRSNLLKTSRAFPYSSVAIGLSLTENDHPGALAALIAGKHDDKIDQLALLLDIIDAPVYLRLAYEFDGVWNRGYENTGQYIAAYRHVVDRLRELGVRNVDYVWQASTAPVDDVIEGRHEDIRAWYPGDSYVDWMATSWFVPPDESPMESIAYRPQTGRTLNDEILAFARERQKPVMIAEAAPQGFDLTHLTRRNIGPVWDGPSGENSRTLAADQIWQAWYQPFFDYIEANRDVIKAVAYINANWDSQGLWDAPYENGYWGDSRVQQNPEILRRWQARTNGDLWRHSDALLFEDLGFPRD